jgi:YD repeat-containing protein
MISIMFDKFITALFAALAIILVITTFARGAESTAQRDAPTTRFYDSRGNATGSASTYGNQTRFYDSRGNSVGTTTRQR